jgi:hypothetical protein
LVKGKRLKLFYAAQTTGDSESSAMEGGAPATPEFGRAMHTLRRAREKSPLHIPEFVLFVNDPQLLTEAYRRYLEARIREAEQCRGLPIVLTLRARAQKAAQSRGSDARQK